jgi:hypothetical protein
MSQRHPTEPGKRIAVMQPYFFPYLGYFRLFSAVDEFVLYDCVQMPRRGRVHRTQVASQGRDSDWLGLPLARQPRDVLIRDLAFSADARGDFDRRLASLPWVAAARGPDADRLRDYLHAPLESVVDFLESGLRLVMDMLELDTPILRSSSLDIDAGLRAQDRILAIAHARGATCYLNSPGGRELYDAPSFTREGVELEFLPPYVGAFVHLLPALMRGERSAMATELKSFEAEPR